ncbi:MAG: hypothetical protein ACK4UN_05970 [Limisphaerales bacterium]
MNSSIHVSDYLTAAQVARKIDQPTPKVLRAIHQGALNPDQTVAGRIFLFRSTRLPDIQEMFAPKMEVAA